MFKSLKALFTEKLTWVVDHDRKPLLPVGARRLRADKHKPVARGLTTMAPENLKFVEIPSGMTCEEFLNIHKEAPLCDAAILDSLMEFIRNSEGQMEQIVKKYFDKLRGQIFFLGTEFESHNGGPSFSYIRIPTGQALQRQLYPAAHVMKNSDTRYVAHFRKDLPST